MKTIAMIRAMGLVIPALTVVLSPFSAEALEVQPTPDADGHYSFEAEAGEIIAFNRQYNPGNEFCYFDLVSSEGLMPVGEILKLTPYSETVVAQVEQSGRYQYSVEAQAEGDTCDITVQLAPLYQQWWVEAESLGHDTEDIEQSLMLLTQVIEAEPRYPEPYKQRVGRLLELNIAAAVADEDFENPDIIGPILVAMPVQVRETISADLEQLAQIYEGSPSWQQEPHDSPVFIREFSSFVQTGVASDLVRELIF